MADYKNTLNLPDTPFPMRGDLAKREPQLGQAMAGEPALRAHPQGRAGAARSSSCTTARPMPTATSTSATPSTRSSRTSWSRASRWPASTRPTCRAGTATACRSSIRSRSCTARTFRPPSSAACAAPTPRPRSSASARTSSASACWATGADPISPWTSRSEADIIRSLGRIHARGYLYRGAKPVHWCIDCHSALAEAEVEYEDRTSPAIDVAFAVVDLRRLARPFGFTHLYEPSFAVIWTTTPWTLPANQAVCVHPELHYNLVRTPKGLLVLAEELREQCLQRYGLTERFWPLRGARPSKELELQHPFYRAQGPRGPRQSRDARGGNRPGAYRAGPRSRRLRRGHALQPPDRQSGGRQRPLLRLGRDRRRHERVGREPGHHRHARTRTSGC